MSFQIYNGSNYNTISYCEADADEYGVDIYRSSGGTAGPSPQNNIVENSIIKSKYVGVRIKSYRSGSTWLAFATTGPINNIVRDNTISAIGTSIYAALELHATRTNTILRNKISSTGNTALGTIAFLHHTASQIIENNYVVNHSPFSVGFPNAAIAFDDNTGLGAGLTHNSFYAESYALYYANNDGGGTFNCENISIYNNIFYSNAKDAIYFEGVNAKFAYADGNMYYAPAGSVAVVNGATMSFAAWKTYDPDAAAAGSELQGFNANPSYMNPASDNLDLNSGSPAIDVVNVATSVSNDIYSIARPVGPKKDVGAYESVLAPIQLLYFIASCDGEKVTVTWITATEINNDYFVLEKSVDGINFTEVAQVDGQGQGVHSKTTTYQYADSYDGASYYRIKQTDLDGSSTYTHITQSNCTSQKVVVLNYGDRISIVCPGAENGDKIQVSILSLKGQEVVQTELSLSSDKTAELAISNLSSSMYILTVKKGGELFSAKFLKE